MGDPEHKDDELNISDAEHKAGVEAEKDREKVPASEAFKEPPVEEKTDEDHKTA
jgi:hypothetical protein